MPTALRQLGFDLYATAGTARLLNSNMVATNVVRKIGEGKPDILDLLDERQDRLCHLHLRPRGASPRLTAVKIRRKAVERSIPCFTSIDTADAFVSCLELDMDTAELDLVDITRL